MKITFDGCGLNTETGLRFATVPASRLANDPNVRETGEAIASAATACHGLDLPANVEPGILAELVAQARRCDTHGRQYGSPGHEAEVKALAAILAKLTP